MPPTRIHHHAPPVSLHEKGLMPMSTVQTLVDSGIHFGQRRTNWNPKMARFIFGERNKIHIIDIRETLKGLLLAQRFIEQVVASGKDVCFVGTKRQAKDSIAKYATEVGMPFVNERWLGGILTNFRTIRDRLGRLEELDRLVESGEIDTYSKKMASQLMRERRKITRNLDGIRTMEKMPGVLMVVDVNRETIALREARSLGIPTIGLVDTDGDPDLVDIAIPGNDDSIRAVEAVLRELCASISRGKGQRTAQAEGDDAAAAASSGDEDAAPTRRRRSSRASFRSDDGGAPEAEDPATEG